MINQAHRIARLEHAHSDLGGSGPVFISWDEDPTEPSHWACALVDGPSGKTILKSDNETLDDFERRVATVERSGGKSA